VIVAGIASFNAVLPNLIEQSGRNVLLDDMLPSGINQPGLQPTVGDQGAPRESFGDVLTNTINSVNQVQQESSAAQTAMLNGEPIELHDVMIKAEEAGLSMDLMLEIRNKLINGYNELIHMPL
jgi:flagellar hook-basal body complex protein FliE